MYQSERIRTSGLSHPRGVRCQAAPRSVYRGGWIRTSGLSPPKGAVCPLTLRPVESGWLDSNQRPLASDASRLTRLTIHPDEVAALGIEPRTAGFKARKRYHHRISRSSSQTRTRTLDSRLTAARVSTTPSGIVMRRQESNPRQPGSGPGNGTSTESSAEVSYARNSSTPTRQVQTGLTRPGRMWYGS
jgi:hypothetical protein